MPATASQEAGNLSRFIEAVEVFNHIQERDMATHTPGPWTLHPTTIHPAVRSVGTPDAGPRRICTVGSMNGNPVDKANARLIAAAPELLEALKLAAHCLQWHAAQHPAGMDCKALEDARAAIAKATQ